MSAHPDIDHMLATLTPEREAYIVQRLRYSRSQRRRERIKARDRMLRDLHARFYPRMSSCAAATELEQDFLRLRYHPSSGTIPARWMDEKVQALMRAIDLGAKEISSARIRDILNGRTA